MKLDEVKIQNFRGYRGCIEIPIENMTAFVGRNDVGKSTVLDALDIFFNDKNAISKMEKNDMNVYASEDDEIVISACFSELPTKVILDTTFETTLEAEYLLNREGKLEIVKRYGRGTTAKVYIRAKHPTNPECSELLLKKQNELKSLIKSLSIVCENQTANPLMRTAIWNHFKGSLDLNDVEIDASKEDAKRIWEKIAGYLPVYTLFKADRKNDDGDIEVQDPLKEAVKQILSVANLQTKLAEVASEVTETLNDVSRRTLEKLREMNPEVAENLKPNIPPVESLKWADVFKNVSITGDDDIPLNKRGGGVKRLILLNFFRAEAERKNNISSNGIIYAIEEPETSQHADNQRMLIAAFKALASAPKNQVILTTHSPIVVKDLDLSSIRLVLDAEEKQKVVHRANQSVLKYSSVNEVNYIAFGEATEEYHDELYGLIEHQGWKSEYSAIQSIPCRSYICDNKGKPLPPKDVTLTDYVRHQIHHPENKYNSHYTRNDLFCSIDLMRDFIKIKLKPEIEWTY